MSVSALDPGILDEFQQVLQDCNPQQKQPGLYKIDQRHASYIQEMAAEHGTALKAPNQWISFATAGRNLEKLERVRTKGIEAIRVAKAEGIPIAFGTDLLGHMHARQTSEYALRAAAMTPAEILQSATAVAARLLNQEGRLGVIEPGAWADLIVVEGDPTASLAPLEAPDRGLRAVMKAGRFHFNRL